MNRAERRRQQKLAQRAAAFQSTSPEAQYNQANALHDQGDLKGAIAHYRSALALRPDFVEAQFNLGIALKDAGDLEGALEQFRKAAALLPGSPQVQSNLGSVLVDTGRTDEAVEAYRKALSTSPADARLHFNLGVALRELARYDEAIARYREAISLAPGYADAHVNLMQLLEFTNRTEDLRGAVAEFKRQCAGDPRAVLGEARICKRDGELAAARSILEAAGTHGGDADFLTERAYLLGELCDRLGDADAAYRHFLDGSRLIGGSAQAEGVDGKRYLDRIALLKSRFTADWIATWRPLEAGDDRPDPVFLVGFPRSGTTLLDTVLRSHDDVAVLEEIPALRVMRGVLRDLPGGDPDGLAALSRDGWAALRDRYFAEIAAALGTHDVPRIVIDKLPLSLIEAGLIHRVFPKARFLFALRHPCDSVLSCFMQKFKLNDAMANLLTLEDAAHLYDEVMTLWMQYRAVLPLSVHTVRYESLVGAFDETVSAVLDFLDLEWDDGVRNYAETARSRDMIRTPSYFQVTQPLYSHAQRRWERYREPMAPVLPVLLGWAERFGYSD